MTTSETAAYPKASYPLNKVLTAIAKQHKMVTALTDDDMAGHALSDKERAALKAGDIAALFHLGANPYLIRRVFRQNFSV